MFDIDKKPKIIHCTRGDHGGFNFMNHLKDGEGYLKYSDADNNIYWYNEDENVVYDNSYQKVDVKIETLTPEFYDFSIGDIVRFKVMRANRCTEVMLSKDFKVHESTKTILITLDKDNTTIGSIINKPTDYWYEIELNPDTMPKTVLGYDKKGPKIFRLYPEGDKA